MQQVTDAALKDDNICSMFTACEWEGNVQQGWNPTDPYTHMNVLSYIITNPVDIAATPECISDGAYEHRVLLLNYDDNSLQN